MLEWDALQAKLREIEVSLDVAHGRVVVAPRDVRAALLDMERALLLHELKEWDESLHPRGEGGRFVSGGGGGVSTPVTHLSTWKSSRTGLDTAHLTGVRARAVDPPHLPAKLAEQRMLDLYDRAIEQGHAEDANWYVDKHNEIGQWADQLGVDRQRFTDAVAATSPLTNWNLKNGRLPNLEAARAMVQVDRAHPGMTPEQIREITPHSKPYPFIGNNAENAIRALRGEDPDEVFNANKIRSFNNNLSHPESAFDVTVDTHMGRAMLNLHEDTEANLKAVNTLIQGRKIGRGPSATTVGGYGWAADRVRSAASARNMNPAAFQAVVWEQWRREGGALTNRSPEAIAARMMKMTDEPPDDMTEEQAWEIWQDIIEWAEQGAPEDWKPGDQAKTVEEKFNPYHDADTGRFTDEGGAGFVSSWGKPKEGAAKPVVGPTGGVRADTSPERMRARREAMIAEADRRTASLKARMTEAQRQYDQVGEDYQHAAQNWSDMRDMVGSLPKSIEDAKRLGASPEVIKQLEDDQVTYGKEYEDAKTELDRQMHNMDVTQNNFWATKHEVDAARDNLTAELRAKYVNSPTGPGNLAITGYRGDLTPISATEVPKNWTQGVQRINEMTGQVTQGFLQPRIKFMAPDDQWFDSGRSYHSSGTGMVTMHPRDNSDSTVVHEMGHWLEDNIPGMGPRIQAHIESRTQGEPTVSLRSVTGSNYNDNEVTHRDQFADPYMGKDYGPNAPTSHEFLSMALQLMHDDPVKFARDDPQSFDFTQQLLAEAREGGRQIFPTPLSEMT